MFLGQVCRRGLVLPLALSFNSHHLASFMETRGLLLCVKKLLNTGT